MYQIQIMELNLLDIVSILYSFAAIILIVFLLSSSSQRPLSNILLSFYFFFSILDAASQFVSYFIYPKHPIIGFIISETVFFIMPFFYLFVKSSVYRDFKLTKSSILHLAPYIIVNIIFIPGYFVPLLADESTDWVSLIYDTHLVSFMYISIHTQIFLYFFLIYRLLFRYKKLLLENYSSSKLNNYKWLMQLVSVFFISDLISTLKNYIRFNSNENLYWISTTFVSVLALCIIFWLIIKALKNPQLFTGVNIEMQLVKDMVKEETKLHSLDSATLKVSDGEHAELVLVLQNHMKKNEPYLDSSLSIYELAKQLNVNTRDLSIAINHDLNKHFFDFVNEYRINKAMEIIRNSDDEKLTILEVLYDVGFNSKSSFNTAFKKHTGLTPTEFKNKTTLSVA